VGKTNYLEKTGGFYLKTITQDIIGDYKIIKFLTPGGHTDIFLGHHKNCSPNWENLVTIKKSKENVREAMREQIRNEAMTLSNLHCVYAPRFIEWDQDNEEYIIMEYLIGKSLDKMSKIRRTEMIDLTLELLDALECLHAHKICHRDFKPGNVVIGNKVTLIDFSIAAELIQGCYVIPTGTPLYSPPESYKEGSCYPEVDVFGLGAIMYFMLTGQDPITAEGLIETSFYYAMYSLITRKNPLKSIIKEKVNEEELSDIVVECLSEDPMTRPSIGQIRSVIQKLERRPRMFVQGNTHFLLKDRVTVGASRECDIRINDVGDCIDKVHAIIHKEGDFWYILDNNSRNGLFVKKAEKFFKVEETPLVDGSYVSLGYSDRKGPHISLRFRS
jgi:serine/threonine protein kinase